MTTLLTDHLRAQAAEFGDRVAYRIVGGGEMTFAEWEAESNRLARSLTELGVRKGDRVSIYVSPEEALRFMVGYSAVHKAGGVAVPTNTRLAGSELERLLTHADVSVVLTDVALCSSVEKIVDTLPDTHHLVVAPGPGEGHAPWSWGELAAGGLAGDTSTYQVALGDDDLADILYTSGTTGTPKGVAIRHRNVALIPGAPNPGYSGQCWLHASPLFTFAGIGFIYNPMQLGLFGVYQPRFDAERWLETVDGLRPQFVFLVPSMAQLIVAHPLFEETSMSSIHICAIGSAPLAPGTLRALQEKMPEASVSNSYGMTEAGPAYCSMPKGESLNRIGSVGQPMPPLEVRIVDEDGRDVATGEVGEALLRMRGREREYYRDAEATASTWSGGWLRTGDLARL
ncbi:MAG: class I adenylate-forming enzyme family protein, partial [Acidimicrobiales bacterium]